MPVSTHYLQESVHDIDTPFVRNDEAADCLNESGFPCAVRAQNTDNLPFVHVEGDVIVCEDLAVALDQAARPDGGRLPVRLAAARRRRRAACRPA